MAFNTSTKKITERQLVKTIDSKINGKFTLEDETIIDRLLDGYGEVSIVEETASGDFVHFRGSVNFTTLFSTADKTLDSYALLLDFQEKLQLTSTEGLALMPEIIGYSFSKDGEKSASVVVNVRTKVYVNKIEEFVLVCGEEENYFTKKDTLTATSIGAFTKTSFNLTEEIKVSGGVDKVLLTTISPSLLNVKANKNFARVEGVAFVNILYIEGDKVNTLQKSIDFIEEVSCENLTEEMLAMGLLNTKSSLTSIKTDETENKLIVDIGIDCFVWGQTEERIEVITDAYSSEYNSVVTTSLVNAKTKCQVKYDTDRQNIIFDTTTKKRIDEIIMLGKPTLMLEQITESKDKVNVIGEISVGVIYKNYDADELLSSVLVSPFNLSFVNFDNPEDLKEKYVAAQLYSKCNMYKNKAGKELSVSVDFDAVITSSYENQCAYVSALEQKNKLENKNYSIKIVRPEKDSNVYDIAKSLGVSPDVLVMQNPKLEEGYREKVVVYVKSK